MGRTDRYIDAHKDIMTMARELSGYLKPDKLAKEATAVRSLLNNLAGKIKVHLTMEDNVLYPELLQHKDDKVKAMAKAFQVEMGGIKKALEDYLGKWSTPQKISADPGNFIKETEGLLGVLAKRVDKENTELYPTYERAA